MKILVVGLNYAPDFIGIPKYTTEFCEGLVLRGHQVEVVTAPPYYPAWRIPTGYRGGWRSEVLNGVRIVRAPIYVPSKPGGLTRLLHHLSFALTALPTAIGRALQFQPDVVLTVAPSLMSAPVALAAAKVARARSWLHIQDFEIDAAFELGMLNGEVARAWAERLERRLLGAFDRVSTISQNMRQLLLKKGVGETSALEVRNWVDVSAIEVWPSHDTSYREELKIPPDHKVALYSGNMAAKQGLEVFGDVAAILESNSVKVTLLLCGQGPVKSLLEDACSEYSNVRFLNLQPTEKLPELLATADIHLLPQRAEAADLVLPSKLTGMLASGRPVIAMAERRTGLAEEVQGCGIVTPPGDAEAMAAAIVKLAEDPLLVAELGAQARARAEERWERSAILNLFESELTAVVKGAKVDVSA